MEHPIYGNNKGGSQSENEARTERPRRPRNLTCLKLQWLAERIRKIEALRVAVANGTYHVDSEKVARAVLGLEPAE